MHNGFMYCFGGYNGNTDVHFADFFRYDPGKLTNTLIIEHY